MNEEIIALGTPKGRKQMKVKSMPAIWSKVNARGQTLELCGDPNKSSAVELWVDDCRHQIYGENGNIFDKTTNPEVFAFSGTKFAITKTDKDLAHKMAVQVRDSRKIMQARWAKNLKGEIAKYPGLQAALERYGVYDNAHAAEDVVAADLLRRWESRA